MGKKKITTRIKESSWQTTLAGLLTLAASGAVIYGQLAGRPDIANAGTAAATVLAGGGLVIAKDRGK